MLLVLAIPAVRSMMEGDMALHMLCQFPLLLLAGWLLAKGLPARARLQQWNRAGIAGLLMASLVLMFWMIPRALDMALSASIVELLKFLTLLMAGAALELSWQSAGLIVRGFFLGNVLPMMMVVGWLYVEAPVRICNAYLTDDQLRAGSGLLALAIAGSAVWLLAFFCPPIRSKEIHDENQ
ncbi:MAG: hypothetical protein M0P59_11550 [Gallionella sp.]|jgi:hypothetical protein|nr:hypothetical protein [Gallionella sp.]MCK9354779.1 hypothetical protein [Gallionella sp.]